MVVKLQHTYLRLSEKSYLLTKAASTHISEKSYLSLSRKHKNAGEIILFSSTFT